MITEYEMYIVTRADQYFFSLIKLINDPVKSTFRFYSLLHRSSLKEPRIFFIIFTGISVRSTEMSVALLRFMKSAVLYMYQCVRESNRHQESVCTTGICQKTKLKTELQNY